MTRFICALLSAYALAACTPTNPITGQHDPVLIYGKGKCTLSGMGAASIAMPAGQNGFSISQDFGTGCELYIGPPPANFNPASVPIPQ